MDCSTFSCDLHVLSAPPALILSRDQTLIEKCRVIESPQPYSEILTSSSLLHPTRLSKICAAHPRHHRNDAADGRPRNLCAACSHYNRARGSNLDLKKEPNRKAVFRSERWPARSFVTIPYKRVFIFYTTRTRRSATGAQKNPQIPVTRSEYQTDCPLASGFEKVFRMLSPPLLN
jgi:hypothetical protein